MKKVFTISTVFLSLFFTSCLENDINEEQQELTNQQLMLQLNVEDPIIWNSLTTQSIDLSTIESSALKSATKATEYPGKDKYYFAIFEDLYPSEGDYDFNDIMLRSKLTLDGKNDIIFGNITTTLINKGGSLPIQIGLMFYDNNGKKYTRIANENIKINGVALPKNGSPWLSKLEDLGKEWVISFEVDQKIKSIWINYFIKTDKAEILSSGFAPTNTLDEFTIPQPNFLNYRNLPWGLEIEAESFDIPNEKELFLNCYPEFQEWAESNGNKNPKWFDAPNSKYTREYIE